MTVYSRRQEKLGKTTTETGLSPSPLEEAFRNTASEVPGMVQHPMKARKKAPSSGETMDWAGEDVGEATLEDAFESTYSSDTSNGMKGAKGHLKTISYRSKTILQSLAGMTKEVTMFSATEEHQSKNVVIEGYPAVDRCGLVDTSQQQGCNNSVVSKLSSSLGSYSTEEEDDNGDVLEVTAGLEALAPPTNGETESMEEEAICGDNGEMAEESTLLRTFAASASTELPGFVFLKEGAHCDPHEGRTEPSGYNPGLFPNDNEFQFRLELTKLVNSCDPRPPKRFIDDLLVFLREQVIMKKVDLSKIRVKQQSFVKSLRQMMGRTALPTVAIVAVESGAYQSLGQFEHRNEYRDTARVVTWNAFDQVRSLLGNTLIFGNMNHLVVNRDDPFTKYMPEDGRLGEVMSGEWYDRAWEVKEQYHQSRTDLVNKRPMFLIPLILGCDATGTDVNNRLKSEPVMMTFALIRQHMRNKTDTSWRCLGMMPPLDHKSKNARLRERQGNPMAQALKAGLNTRNYHRCLHSILGSLIEMQKQGMVLNLKFGKHTKEVHCYFPLSLWLGDIKSQDMLAGRVMSHRAGLPRLCWQCSCPFEDIDRHNAACETFNLQEYRRMTTNCELITVFDPERNIFVGGVSTTDQKREYLERFDSGTLEEAIGENEPWQAEPIMELGRFDQYLQNLKSVGCVRVDSVMNELDYGGAPGGQFEALGIDILHSLLGGVIKQVAQCFFRGMPSATKEMFEEVSDRMFLGQRSSERKYLPRMNFTHGTTNLTQLTCREWAGLMVVILMVSQSQTGSAVLETVVRKTRAEQKKQADNRRRTLSF